MTIAWLFPGQGTQAVGMGKALFDGSPAAREVFERADAALGWSISKLCFEGPAEQLTLTANTQPAILTTSIAALAALREALPDLAQPSFVAGHSLGEYSALVAAGALSLEDAVRVVNLRGKAMQEAVPAGVGAMAAIMGATPEQITQLCVEAAGDEIVSPANFNTPGQVVISGHASAVERAKAACSAAGLKVIPLNVSAPFHCALMVPAAKAVQAALAELTINAPSCPVVSNVEATPNGDSTRIAELLVRQVDGTVRWEQSVRAMADAGVTKALEIGPGAVLAGMVKRIDKRISVLSVGDAAGIAKVAAFLA